MATAHWATGNGPAAFSGGYIHRCSWWNSPTHGGPSSRANSAVNLSYNARECSFTWNHMNSLMRSIQHSYLKQEGLRWKLWNGQPSATRLTLQSPMRQHCSTLSSVAYPRGEWGGPGPSTFLKYDPRDLFKNAKNIVSRRAFPCICDILEGVVP